MIIDMHVHTMVSSVCSSIAPEDLVKTAMEIGLDGICVTEHGAIEGAMVAKEIGRKYDFPIFTGMEVQSREGHLLLFGYMEKIEGVLPAHEIIDMVEAVGGIVIPAHPYRVPFGWYSGAVEQALEESEFVKMFRVIEMYNGLSLPEENRTAEEFCKKTGIYGIGGSDAHWIGDVGCCTTIFEAEIADEKQLMEELKKGTYSAKINDNYTRR